MQTVEGNKGKCGMPMRFNLAWECPRAQDARCGSGGGKRGVRCEASLAGTRHEARST